MCMGGRAYPTGPIGGGPNTNGGGIMEGGGQQFGGAQIGLSKLLQRFRSLTNACTTLKGNATTPATNRPVPSTMFARELSRAGGEHEGGTQRGGYTGTGIGAHGGGGQVITGPYPVGGHTGPPAKVWLDALPVKSRTIKTKRKGFLGFIPTP